MWIENISKGCFVGAGLPMEPSFDVMASRFAGVPTASLIFNGAEVATPAVEVVRPADDRGYPGQLRVTLDLAALMVGSHVLQLTDAGGTAPGVQIFIGRI